MTHHTGPAFSVDFPAAAPVKKYPVRTVEVVCRVDDDSPSYMVGGIRQRSGDKVRLPLGDALGLERMGKVMVVSGTERVEML